MKIISDAEIQTSVLPRMTLSALLHSQAVALTSSTSPTVQCPPRLTLTMPHHTQLFMPARTSSSVVKIVSVPLPGAPVGGIPGVNLLFDDATGKVTHVVNSTCLTALRTAAGSLLSSVLECEREGVRGIVVFGDGAQGVFHVWLHLRYFTHVESVTLVVGSHRELSEEEVKVKGQTFERKVHELCETSSSPPVPVKCINATDQVHLTQALGGASLVFTCTPSLTPLFNLDNLPPHAHICAVGSYKPSMCELPPNLVLLAAQNGGLTVDDVEACAREAGCLIKNRSDEDRSEIVEKCTPISDRLTTLGEGEGEQFLEKLESWSRKRERGGVTVFKSVGVGLQDVEITRLVVAMAGGVGTEVAF